MAKTEENMDNIINQEDKLSEKEIESLYEEGKKDYLRIIKALNPWRLVAQKTEPKKIDNSDKLE